MNALESCRLPTPSDICASSFRWALSVLHEPPVRLVVRPEDEAYARRAVDVTADCDVELVVDASLPGEWWRVEGATRMVTSE